MNEPDLARILGRCLDQMAAGETAASCLARYPEYASELAPLLAQASELSLLRDYRLDEATRRRTRARILQAEAARDARAAQHWWQGGAFALPRLATGALVVLLCLVLTTGMVAASRPGDLAYGMRVIVERAPVLLARGPEDRARTELGLAARRLAELDRTLRNRGQAMDARTLAALLASVEHIEGLAVTLPDATRNELAASLAEQARRIAQLEDLARTSQDGAALETAARRTERVAAQVGLPGLPPAEPPVEPGVATTSTLMPRASHTPTPGRTMTPTRHATRQPPTRPAHTVTPQPEPAITAVGPHASATPRRLGPSATPQGPAANATPQGPNASATPQGPAANATPQGPNASATPQGPNASTTPQGPGATTTPRGSDVSATPQGPGASATPQGPGASVTPQGPGPDATPQGPGASVTPQGPGPDATPQGPGATPVRTPGGHSGAS